MDISAEITNVRNFPEIEARVTLDGATVDVTLCQSTRGNVGFVVGGPSLDAWCSDPSRLLGHGLSINEVVPEIENAVTRAYAVRNFSVVRNLDAVGVEDADGGVWWLDDPDAYRNDSDAEIIDLCLTRPGVGSWHD